MYVHVGMGSRRRWTVALHSQLEGICSFQFFDTVKKQLNCILSNDYNFLIMYQIIVSSAQLSGCVRAFYIGTIIFMDINYMYKCYVRYISCEYFSLPLFRHIQAQCGKLLGLTLSLVRCLHLVLLIEQLLCGKNKVRAQKISTEYSLFLESRYQCSIIISLIR